MSDFNDFITLKTDKEKDSVAPKALLVSFELSAAGKRINNRIYSPKGQRENAATWTNPYKKPILVHHDEEKGDPIGRFQSVRYESLEAQAIKHLGSVTAYHEIVRALDSGNTKAINQVMKKHKLYTDKNWPGVGRLWAEVKITDADAIQKFLDERYLTFSAGSSTDRYACLACGQDWKSGTLCEHRPGMEDEEGNVGVFMTGAFIGDEASVVNNPANRSSVVSTMQMVDSEGKDVVINDAENLEKSAQVEFSNNNEDLVSSLFELNIQTVLDCFVEDKLGFNLVDAITNKTEEEKAWTAKLADALETDSTESLAPLKAKLDSYKPKVDKAEEPEQKDLPWEILDLAVEGLVPAEKRLTKEARSALEKEVFLKDGFLPVHDLAYYEAVATLLEKYKTPEVESLKVALADRKLVLESKAQLDETSALYANALKTVDEMKKLLTEIVSIVNDKLGVTHEFDDTLNKVEQFTDWLDIIKQSSQNGVKKVEITPIQNPSISSSEDNSQAGIGEFEREIINNYKSLLAKDQKAASRYLHLNKKYLPQSFDIKSLS